MCIGGFIYNGCFNYFSDCICSKWLFQRGQEVENERASRGDVAELLLLMKSGGVDRSGLQRASVGKGPHSGAT